MKPEKFEIADRVNDENKLDKGTEYTDEEIDAAIKKIAGSRFQMTLNDKELDKVRAKIRDILQYEKGKDIDKENGEAGRQAKLEIKVEAPLKKVKDIKDFVQVYFAAKTLFEQLNTEDNFYGLNPENPEKLMSFLSGIDTNTNAREQILKIASRLKNIKETLGGSGDKRICLVEHGKNGWEVYEGEIKKVVKSGHILFDGRQGSFSPFPIFKDKEEAEEYAKKKSDEEEEILGRKNNENKQ